MIKLHGHIEVDHGVRIVTNWDLCRYYQWHISKHFYNTIKTQLPRFGGHVSIILPLHNVKDLSPVKYLHGKPVDFWIDPVNIHKGRSSFWLPAKCDMADFIKKELGVKDDTKFYGYHCTISNTK